MYTLTNTINFSQPFVQYSPLSAGFGFEPAISIASMIRNSMLNAPMTWSWNRKEDTSLTTVSTGTQDYTVAITDFGFLEVCSIKDPDTGEIIQLKDIQNTSALGVAGANVKQQPNAVSIIANNIGTNIKVRFMGMPDKAYAVTLTYQVAAPLFGPFLITSVANAVGGNTTYTGIFTPQSFPVGATAKVTGCTNAVNNTVNFATNTSFLIDGGFPVVSCSATTLVLANPSGVAETTGNTAFAANFSWGPIPDQYSDVYNNLFLSEAFTDTDDAPRAQMYRQRGVAALLSKAEGLTETQRNAFVQQWLARSLENVGVLLKLQQATQARGI